MPGSTIHVVSTDQAIRLRVGHTGYHAPQQYRDGYPATRRAIQAHLAMNGRRNSATCSTW
eukprot:322125-Rhodomonas_salina.1